MKLASLDSRAENVRVEPIIVSELKLGNVERQIFLADLVEAADDTALEDARHQGWRRGDGRRE